MNWDRTEFQEDMGIWLARWPKFPEPRWQPFCMGRNMRGAGWCAGRRYHNEAVREDRTLWLKIKIGERKLKNAAPQEPAKATSGGGSTNAEVDETRRAEQELGPSAMSGRRDLRDDEVSPRSATSATADAGTDPAGAAPSSPSAALDTSKESK